MDPIANMIGGDMVRRYANSALPDAPVVAQPQRHSGPVRRAAANRLRGLADRLSPVAAETPQRR